jgi:myo-inositol-1(or 4)-monophosphatase
VVGVVFDPTRNAYFQAEKGSGACLDDQPIRVSPTAQLSDCLLSTGFPFRAKHLIEPYLRAFQKVFAKISDFRRAGSAALDLAYLACGRTDGFWEIMLNQWDIAAGALLVKEAGGTVSDLWGRSSYLQNGHIVASNGLIHRDIIAMVGPEFVATLR